MPDRSTLYAENITTIYSNLVVIDGMLNDGTPVHIYLNDSGVPVTFKGNTYQPCAFQATPPDRNDMEENSGTLSFVGVPQSYIEQIQSVVGIITVSLALIRTDQLTNYILPPVEFTVSNITISSANASVTLNLRSGGSLGFVASARTYSTTDFPGLNG